MNDLRPDCWTKLRMDGRPQTRLEWCLKAIGHNTKRAPPFSLLCNGVVTSHKARMEPHEGILTNNRKEPLLFFHHNLLLPTRGIDMHRALRVLSILGRRMGPLDRQPANRRDRRSHTICIMLVLFYLFWIDDGCYGKWALEVYKAQGYTG